MIALGESHWTNGCFKSSVSTCMLSFLGESSHLITCVTVQREEEIKFHIRQQFDRFNMGTRSIDKLTSIILSPTINYQFLLEQRILQLEFNDNVDQDMSHQFHNPCWGSMAASTSIQNDHTHLFLVFFTFSAEEIFASILTVVVTYGCRSLNSSL